MKSIVILVALDTKSEETKYLKRLIEDRGHSALVLDIGYGGTAETNADIPVSEVFEAIGADPEKVTALRNESRRDVLSDMAIGGAVIILNKLHARDEISGVISMGGTSSAAMASTIMREVPYRIPKLIFTTAAGLTSCHRLFGPTGITVMHSLVEVGGLNYLLRGEIQKAAGAICGMVDSVLTQKPEEHKPIIAMSTCGWIDKSAHRITELLEDDYEVVCFHATGVPEVVMEKMVEDGLVKAVIDLVPSSITNALYNGSRISWPRRLEAAGEAGIPQIVAPVLLNVISRAREESAVQIEERSKRVFYFVDNLRILLWLNKEETLALAPVYAEKLNKAKGPVTFLFPAKGWLSIETQGSPLFDAETEELFMDEMKKLLKPEIAVESVDANVDDDAFAEAVVSNLRSMLS